MRRMLIGLVVASAIAGCGDAPEPGRAVTPTVSPGGVERRWIGVMEVAADPNDLDALTQRMLEPLGGALIVAPVDCFRGLPDTARDGYVIGAVGDSRQEVERLVLDAGEEVAFSANVSIVCTD